MESFTAIPNERNMNYLARLLHVVSSIHTIAIVTFVSVWEVVKLLELLIGR